MQRKTTSMAAGIVLATCGLAANAMPFDANDAEIDATYYLSGATASAQFIRNSLIQNACKATSTTGKDLTVFEVDEDDWVLVCELLPAVGTQTVRMIKQGGGSGDGTTPIAQPAASPIQYPVPAVGFNPAVSCGAGGPAAATTGAGNPFLLYSSCVIPNQVVNGGDIGTSDVEPKLFFDLNTPSTGIAFTPADNALITTKALAGLGFGIGVTKSLRNALQALQFPLTSDCNPGKAGTKHGLVLPAMADTNGDGINEALDVAEVGVGTFNAVTVRSESDGTATVADSEQCMPNLTSAEVTGLASGKITDWVQVQRNGTTLVAAATAAGIPVPLFNAVVPGLNNRRVHFCRRNEGSGTQAQFNAHFFAAPCTKIGNTELWEAPSNAGSDNCTFTGATMTCNNRGSSDLARCLNAFETNGVGGNTALPFNNGDANPFNNTRYAWAFGLQSVEQNQDLARAWRFVKLDGLAPTLANVYAADYTDHYEQTCQRRTVPSPIDAGGDGPTLTAIFNAICTGGPVDIFKANLSFLHPFGTAGWLTVPDLEKTAAGVAEAPSTAAKLMDPNGPVPVSSWTRRGESCTAPVVYDSFQSTLEN